MGYLKFYASVIFVKNIETAKKFYTQLLDCEIEHDFGKNITFKGGLSIWELNKSHIIHKKLKNAKNRSTRFELYFETENIKKQFDKLKQAKVSFLHDINEEPWGQFTIRFFDTDGHLVEIGESLKTFVSRMFNAGASQEQVAKKTGIPLKTVISLLH